MGPGAGGSPRAGETGLAPSKRLFVQVGPRVRIRLPPAESHANFWSPLALNHDPRHLEADFRAEEPEVRIHLPPADSPSLALIRYRASRTPAFRAGVRGWLGDRVSRDAPGFPS